MKGMSFGMSHMSNGGSGAPPRRDHKSSFLSNYDGGIGSGILSPALSSEVGSTSVTPLTPMTPMTTPRTPLQILLGRQGLVRRPYRRPSLPREPQQQEQQMVSEEDEEDRYRESQLLALQLFAEFLNTAETTLNDITEREEAGQQVLGPGIVRICDDLATDIEGVARELHHQRTQAEQHLESVMSDHELTLIEEGGVEEKNNSEPVDATFTNSESSASLKSQEEFIETLSTTHTLLLDMAAALRAISQQEAQELGEVALEVARMFVYSLGVVHSNMLQMTASSDHHIYPNPSLEQGNARRDDDSGQKASASTKQVTWSNVNAKTYGPDLGPVVEVFGEEEKRDDHAALNRASPPTKNAGSPPRYAPQLTPIPASPPALSPSVLQAPSNPRHMDRVRVLWPPLLPAITEAGKHCAINAKDHPLPAIAIGLTCGPAAIATAAIAGPPLLVADWAIQTSYNALSEHTPVVENVERGAANALQVARLGLLCSKLLVKQGLAVGERQMERRGGAGKICHDLAEGAVERALHPVETAGMAWDGLWWMGGAVRDAVGFVKDAVGGGDLRVDLHG